MSTIRDVVANMQSQLAGTRAVSSKILELTDDGIKLKKDVVKWCNMGLELRAAVEAWADAGMAYKGDVDVRISNFEKMLADEIERLEGKA